MPKKDPYEVKVTRKEPEPTPFYAAEERAFAPGIAAGWPKVIPAPHTKNGRLVKVDPKLAIRFDRIMDGKDLSDRLLTTLANMPIMEDYTGKKPVARVVPYAPDLLKLGRLIVKARLHLARIGVRKRKI